MFMLISTLQNCPIIGQLFQDRDGLLTEDPILDAPKFNPFIFLPPALCDMTATSIQYIGLTLTYASSFQMLRGSTLPCFSSIFSLFDFLSLRGVSLAYPINDG